MINRRIKRQLKRFFRKRSSATVDEINELLGEENGNQNWSRLLRELGLDPYLEYVENVRPPIIQRTGRPFPYERIIGLLKKAGKLTVSYAVPLAIGMITGGTAVPQAVAPIAASFSKMLEERDIEPPDDLRDLLMRIFGGDFGDAVGNIIRAVIEKNEDKDPEKIRTIVGLTVKEYLGPLIDQVEELLINFRNDRNELADILEDWIDEERDKLSELAERSDRNAAMLMEGLNGIETELARRMEGLEREMLTMHRNLITMDKRLREFERRSLGHLRSVINSIDRIYGRIVGRDITELDAEELLQLSRTQFVVAGLRGKEEELPFDYDKFVPDDDLYARFIGDFMKEESYPLFLLLAHIGMGKTWNAAYLGITVREAGSPFRYFCRSIPIIRKCCVPFSERTNPTE